MKYYSTNDRSLRVDLRHAVMQGLAEDKGLYMPVSIPRFKAEFFNTISKLSFQELAFAVGSQLLGEDLPESELRKIIDHTIQFEVPFIKLEEDILALELFHGPTMAFKDFGARFLSGLMGYYAGQQEKEITILVATSGDTGSAVANGFLNVPGTRVVVLYPSGKVSDIQEKQFTTLGGNITALEVSGTFDDCQALVKQAFLDETLRRQLVLTSANSINIARLIPQTFYYFQAFAQLKNRSKPVVFSVPSGNFGNLTAGLLAKRMGLPISQFVASTNANDIVPSYLSNGKFSPQASIQTMSNAMDVGNPSNFSRILDLYDSDFDRLRKDIIGYSFSDKETGDIMCSAFRDRRYILDPHGAVGYLGLRKYMATHPGTLGIFLETAHPGKFQEVVEKALGQSIQLPEGLSKFLTREKKSLKIGKEYDALKAVLGSL